MSMYDLFKTDDSIEQSGVFLNYGSFRVKIARAGGGNKRYIKTLEAKTRPIRRAIETETVDEKVSRQLMMELYAETIVLDWETEVDGKMEKGIEGPDGKIMPFSKENVLLTFKNLPDLFQDIIAQAGKVSNFRQMQLEEDAKN